MKQEIKFNEFQPTELQKRELDNLTVKFKRLALSYGQDPDSSEMQKILDDRQKELKRIWWLNDCQLTSIVNRLQLFDVSGEALTIYYSVTDSCNLRAHLGPDSLYRTDGTRNSIISSARLTFEEEIKLASAGLSREEHIESKQTVEQYYIERYKAHRPVLAHCGVNLKINRIAHFCNWTNDATGERFVFGSNAREYYLRFGTFFWNIIQGIPVDSLAE